MTTSFMFHTIIGWTIPLMINEMFNSLSVALQLLITSNLLIQKSLQASSWNCPPVKNISCTNVSNYVNCSISKMYCSVQSCDPSGVGCSCWVGSFNWTNYNAPDLCTCGAESQSCYCLGGAYASVISILYWKRMHVTVFPCMLIKSTMFSFQIWRLKTSRA